MKKIIPLLLMLATFLSSISAYAVTTPNSVITAQTPNRGLLQFTHSSTPGTYATAYTGSGNGSKITGVFISNNDSSATHVVTCGVFNSATQYWSYTVTTTSPASGSYNDIAFLSTWPGLPVDSDGNSYIYLASASDTLQCTFATTITSSDFVDVGVIAADF